MAAVTTEKELADALKKEEDTIVIEGKVGKTVITIKATGKLAWFVAIGAIGVAVVAVLASPATGGASAIMGVSVAPAVGILGGAATLSAIGIAVAAGGVGVLNKLRDYEIVEKSDSRVVLRRK